MQFAVLSLQTPTKVSGRIIFGKRGFIFNGKKNIYNIYYSDVLPRHIHIVWNLYHTEDCRVLYHQNAVPKMIFIEIFNASIVVDYNSHPNAFKEKQIMEISKKIVEISNLSAATN